MKSKIKIVPGGVFRDSRGQVTFINDFDFRDIKRFYQVENSNLSTIRAFHGHLKEAKYVYVVNGRILLAAVYLDNVRSPDPKNKVQRMILSAEKPTIVYIPPGWANGFKALQKNTKVIFFSTSSISESLKDDYRYPADYWGKSVWNSSPKHRQKLD